MTIIDLDSLKKRNQKIYTHSVAWGNPYKDPPNNLPRVLFSFESLEHRPDAKRGRKIDKILEKLKAQEIYGYYQCFDCDTINTVKWSEESKQRVRVSRLKKRLTKSFGFLLFWMEQLQKTISEKPDYYGVVNISV